MLANTTHILIQNSTPNIWLKWLSSTKRGIVLEASPFINIVFAICPKYRPVSQIFTNSCSSS